MTWQPTKLRARDLPTPGKRTAMGGKLELLEVVGRRISGLEYRRGLRASGVLRKGEECVVDRLSASLGPVQHLVYLTGAPCEVIPDARSQT